jgi:N-terminal domain of anti-restriction factor ArdC
MQGKCTPSREKVDRAVSEIIALFESGELPVAVARTTILRLETDAPAAAWSLGNRLLMLLAGTDDARGYKQWQGAGRRVRKGAKAFYILAPSTRKITETDDDTGEEVSRTVTVGFLGVPVFRYEDTEGAELERPDYRPTELPPLFEVAQQLGVEVRWLPFADRFYGWYAPNEERIVLCSHDAVVWFHELAHAAHERVLARSGRSLRGSSDPHAYASQEVVAETCAAVIARLWGFDLGNVATAREYVEHYAKGDPAKAVMRVLADVQAVLDLLLQPSGSEVEEPAAVLVGV